eukprot:TRINITY_DN106356_c0_g1_i1.p1 TRINITY_DN106356_c0_g1~~TRINITY_DN106356_c0_g1_i1.p1  ORF type:complete len:138 (+),score=30.14 TRINITY_DN106356_c0_g1_i1:58-471(+)
MPVVMHALSSSNSLLQHGIIILIVITAIDCHCCALFKLLALPCGFLQPASFEAILRMMATRPTATAISASLLQHGFILLLIFIASCCGSLVFLNHLALQSVLGTFRAQCPAFIVSVEVKIIRVNRFSCKEKQKPKNC